MEIRKKDVSLGPQIIDRGKKVPKQLVSRKIEKTISIPFLDKL